MLLIRCSCGCEYKIKENQVNHTSGKQFDRLCPGCGMKQTFTLDVSLAAMCDGNYQIYRIPDEYVTSKRA